MRLEELLEKRERSILRLLHHLKDNPNQSKIREVMEVLGLSRATLLRYIDDFNQEAASQGLSLGVQVVDEDLVYERAMDLPAKSLLHHLLEPSLKYQILTYIFDREEFSLQELAQELLISEASLSRQLSALNKLLAEFGISIRNGRLKGDELQIRYFYFNLFWYAGGSDLSVLSLYKDSQTKLIASLERLYHENFRPKQREQLILWLIICQRRMRLGHLDFKKSQELMVPYLNHKFYHRLKDTCFTFFSQWAGSHQEGDIISLFVFLFAMFILPASKVEQMLAFGGPIKEATTKGLGFLRSWQRAELELNEEALYQLNQLMGQSYFLKGRLFVADTDFELYDFAPEFEEESRALYQDILNRVYGRLVCQEDDLGNYISQELTKLVAYLNREVPRLLLVGLDLSKDKITIRLTLDRLRQELEHNRSIRIEEWQEETTYDLIISDYRQFSDTPNYQLHRGLTKQDIVNLKEVLRSIAV